MREKKDYICHRIDPLALRQEQTDMMKRRIALIFLFFAAFMLAAHAVLPHHHHCHEVVFLKACDLTEPLEEDTVFLLQQENAEHDCYPMTDSDSDPCWQNNQYLSEEHEEVSFSSPADCSHPLFLAFIPIYLDFSILPVSAQKFFVSRHEKPYQDLFLVGIFSLRAPPIG